MNGGVFVGGSAALIGILTAAAALRFARSLSYADHVVVVAKVWVGGQRPPRVFPPLSNGVLDEMWRRGRRLSVRGGAQGPHPQSSR